MYVLLSELFHRLCDYEKSARYAAKAYDLSRSLQLGGDLNSRHHRAALLRMAAALSKQGEMGDARDYIEEATRLALISGDQATYTRSIRIMGDIYRRKDDIDVSRIGEIYVQAFTLYEIPQHDVLTLTLDCIASIPTIRAGNGRRSQHAGSNGSDGSDGWCSEMS